MHVVILIARTHVIILCHLAYTFRFCIDKIVVFIYVALCIYYINEAHNMKQFGWSWKWDRNVRWKIFCVSLMNKPSRIFHPYIAYVISRQNVRCNTMVMLDTLIKMATKWPRSQWSQNFRDILNLLTTHIFLSKIPVIQKKNITPYILRRDIVCDTPYTHVNAW
jgi:hypothetical protein